jgi:secondary thiamine-phosphate synthase enzyme
MVKQESFVIDTRGRSTVEVTDRVGGVVRAAGVEAGIVQVFVHHTSASLVICENADPAVRRDLERFLSDLVPDGGGHWEHDAEGPDDMPAHVRSVLTQTGLSVPVVSGRLGLGTWQGIYLYEHRARGHRRRLTATVIGEPAPGE